VITRSAIELPLREQQKKENTENELSKEEDVETVPVPILKEEHIENIKDLLEVELDGVTATENDPIYVIFHGLCDHIDDLQMIENNGFEIRALFVFLDFESDSNSMPSITDSTAYDDIECLQNVVIQQLSVHKVVSNRKGIESVVPKDAADIALEVRSLVDKLENEWNRFDAKWRKVPLLEIPEIALRDIMEYDAYKIKMDSLQTPDVDAVIDAMIDQIASDLKSENEVIQSTDYKVPAKGSKYRGMTLCVDTESAVFLSMKCGFRKWMKFPEEIKDSEPNAFYGATTKERSLFLRRKCTAIKAKEWIMGLTQFMTPSEVTPNQNRFLWLSNPSNDGVLSLLRSDNESDSNSITLGVAFPDNARLGVTMKSKAESDKITVALSTANGITVEYHRDSGDLVLYQQTDQTINAMNGIKGDEEEEAVDDEEEQNKEDKDGDVDDLKDVDMESEVVWKAEDGGDVIMRTVNVDGAMTVFYSDSSQRRVFPDSEIWTKSKESKWIEIKVNGDCVVDGAVSESVKIKTAKTTDSDSMTSIITRTDNVMVMEQQNGNRVIQCPDSMDILVESSIDSEEWKGHELSQWIESIGVDRESAEQIANDKLKENAEARKTAQKLVRFQLKNDNMMPTVIVHKVEGQQRTECIFDDQFRAVFARSNPPNESADSALSAVSDRGTVTVEHRRFGTLTFGMAKGRKSEALFVPISSTENALEFGIDLKAENPSISWSDSSRIALNGEHSGTILEAPKQSENGGSKAMNLSNEKADEMKVRPAPRTKVEIPSVLGESMDCGTGTGTGNENDSGSVSIDDVVAEDERIGNERRNEIENENENEPETETEAVPALGLRANRESNGNGNGDVAETVTAEENVGYFSNEPFFREFEISCSVAEILAECPPCSGLEKVRTLNALCSRLRALISGKNASDSTVSTLSLDEVEELVTELVPPPESSSDHIDIDITEHLHRLLCSVGLKLDAENGCYVAAKCTILIDGGICFLSSKLDEFHVDFKKRIVAERDAVSEREAVSEMTTMTAAMRMDDERRGAEDITVDTDRHEHHHQDFRAKSISSPPDADLLSRCMSHCSCCPPQSPLRATRMDYLGRTRDHFISIDDLQKYPAPVPQRKLNRKYIESEASVERRVRTSSTFNSTMASQEASIPTVLIQPASFDFGALRIGNVYRFTASITNHGHSQSRFHLSIASQSDPEHPVHIKAYHKMGAIAPGISIALQIELCSESRCGPYSNTLTVKTKKHIFDVDVTAHFVKRSNPEHSESATVQATNKRVVCLGRKC